MSRAVRILGTVVPRVAAHRTAPVRASPAGTAASPALRIAGAVVVASAVGWFSSMPPMDEMPMPGGWTMSMTWMRMPEQSWSGAAASFLAMWLAMMAAMMMPSLVPILERFRHTAASNGKARQGYPTAVLALGYLVVWTLLGTILYPVGVALASAAMRHPGISRAVPTAVAAVFLIAGSLQFTAWKARHLVCCRSSAWLTASLPPDAGSAWRHGARLGIHCICSCAGVTAMLLVVGAMDLGAMALATAAVTAERLAPNGERVARAIGVAATAAGVVLALRAGGYA